VMKVARQMGLELPSHLSIAGFDNSRISQQLWPTLTTVQQPLRELAARSTELLISNILSKPNDTSENEFQCTLLIRESTAAKQT